MAETNEERISRPESARKEMEDTLVVMAHLESKASERIKEHAQFIAYHQSAMRKFDNKLNWLTNIVGRVQSGIESH